MSALDDLKGLASEETRLALQEHVRTEGVVAAYEAALQVLRDPKAPAPAKATTITTLFRVAGYLKNEREGFDPDAASQLSSAQLRMLIRSGQQELSKIESDLAARRQRASETDIFD